jgi:hypothetical protein
MIVAKPELDDELVLDTPVEAVVLAALEPDPVDDELPEETV